MRTIQYILTICFLIGISNILKAQNNTCNVQKEKSINEYQRYELDETKYDLTNGVRDSVSHYNTFYRGGEEEVRLIYFLHGLGGSEHSWDAVDDAFISVYKYIPASPEYVGHQRSFEEASLETQKSMTAERLSIEASVDIIDHPYVIAHSQGGLVARDLDRRYANNIGIFNESVRQFDGLVTFGTSHAGARIAVSQDELIEFASEFSTKIIDAQVANLIENITVKLPVHLKEMDILSTNLYIISHFIGQDVLPGLLNMAMEDKKALMTKQYAPDAPYLNNELNFINPDLAKALFYGVEEEPVFWRIATYIVGKEAYDYPTFEANEDDALYLAFEELRMNMIATVTTTKKDLESSIAVLKNKQKFAFLIPYTKNLKYLSYGEIIQKAKDNIKSQEIKITANEEAEEFLRKANVKYKAIIGSIDYDNATFKVVNYKCITEVTEYVGHGKYRKVEKVTYVDNIDDCDGLCTAMYKRTVPEYPSDGTVTVPSQMAFPGCIDKYKHEMPKTNHIQMRNNIETYKALHMLYNEFNPNMPLFFKLDTW